MHGEFEHREKGALEFVHRWEEIVGGLCRSGFVIEDLAEPKHGDPAAEPGTFRHRSKYIPPYVAIKARRIATPPLGQAERPTETKPKESEIKQAALAKPEPKHFTLPSDFKESREARLAEKQKKTPAPKQPLAPPPIIQSPKEVTSPLAFMSAPIVEPAAKPSEPAKPEKVAATAQTGMPRLPTMFCGWRVMNRWWFAFS